MKQLLSKYEVSGISVLLLTIAFNISAVCSIITPVSNPTYTPISPVAGENVWLIAKRTADAIDMIGPMTTQMATELNDFAYTSSLSYAHACYITKNDLPGYVITSPGIYTVAEPLTLTSLSADGPLIDIQANDVVLDFCGNKLSLTTVAFFNVSAIRVNGYSNVIIRNAILDVSFSNNTILIQNANGIVIENCYIRNQVNAPLIAIQNSSSNVFIKDCILLDGSIGIYTSGSTKITINNCVASNVQYALRTQNVQDLVCTSYYGLSGRGLGVGFDIDFPSSRIVLINCQANSFTTDGFTVNGSYVRLQHCRAFQNTTYGFNLNPFATAGQHIEVISCTAYGNSTGIRNAGSTDTHILNCVSSNNTTNYTGVPNTLAYGSLTNTTGYWTNIIGA